MATTTGRLTARKVQEAKAGRLAPGMYRDSGAVGLYAQITEGGASWIYRYRSNKDRVREQGLGPLSLYGLSEARAFALDARKLLHQGIDPIEHRRAAKTQQRLNEMKSLTFNEAAAQYAAAHRAGWRSEKHSKQWLTSLATHASPIIGAMPVAAIDTPLVLKALEPIWTTKPETASRVRGRIESVLDWSKARGFRTGENPARWRGHLDHLLADRSKVRRVRHHPALAYDEMPEFMAKLRNVAGVGAKALTFLVLTACRPGEVVNARWDEIDLQAKTWTIPPERMKSGREHRVPLSSAALALLAGMDHTDERVFETSATAMLETIHALHPDIVPHGFRSTFRDWCAERTNFPSEVAEMALAHAIPNAVEAAYRRGDMFEKRRRMMEAWASYCVQPASVKGDKVVALRA
jgi:integrase